jgi:hypothetical protein
MKEIVYEFVNETPLKKSVFWDVPPNRRITQYLHGATSQKTAFFIVTALKTSNLNKTRLAKLRGRAASCEHGIEPSCFHTVRRISGES